LISVTEPDALDPAPNISFHSIGLSKAPEPVTVPVPIWVAQVLDILVEARVTIAIIASPFFIFVCNIYLY